MPFNYFDGCGLNRFPKSRILKAKARREREHEGPSRAVPNAFGRVDHNRQVPRDLSVPAAWKESHDPFDFRNAQLRTKLGPREVRLRQPRKRMPDVHGWNAALAKEFFFEGEDTEKAIQRGTHGLHPPLLPGPGLRSHQIDHTDSLPFQLAREGKVEARSVGKNRHVRWLGGAHASQLVHLAEDARDVRDHLDDPYHGDRALIDYGPHSGGLHPRPGATGKLGFRMPNLQGFHQPGGVQIA